MALIKLGNHIFMQLIAHIVNSCSSPGVSTKRQFRSKDQDSM
jgi:hypothetical protein